jgi:gas vesicle protein
MITTEQRLDKTEEKIDHLDALLGQFIAATGTALICLEREMREFKNEMREFKDEMSEFKNEMLEYKDWSKASITNMNAQWGNLARKMGTLVEDIFYPSSDIVIEKYFGSKTSSLMQRRRVRKNGEEFEADILALCDDFKTAFHFEIKSNPDDSDNIKDFKKKITTAFDFLEEIEGYKLVPVYGGLSMKDSTVKQLTKLGIYGVIFKWDVLEIVNSKDIKSG